MREEAMLVFAEEMKGSKEVEEGPSLTLFIKKQTGSKKRGDMVSGKVLLFL